MRETDRRSEWSVRLGELRDLLRGDVARLADLRAVEARRAELGILLDDLDRQLLRATRAAVITLVGATGAGKSAMLNALVGRPIAEEGINRPTTWQPVVYAPQDADLGQLLEHEPGASGSAPRLPGAKVVRYDPAAGPWTAEVVIDTPDVNSVAEAHRETVTTLAERSDILVVVLHRQSVVEESPVSFIDRFARRRALLFVLNRTDELTETARTVLLEQIRQLAASRWGAAEAPVVAVSARVAQVQPGAEWIEFRQVLLRMVRDSALAGVRRHNALGAVERIAELFESIHDETAADLEALPANVAAGLAQLVQRTAHEVSERLALRRNDLCRLLWSQVADRWDGPGGWALRTGSLSTLGMGAGALLARRNPLFAAGAAVGGIAAERVRDVTQHRQLTSVEGLLPSTGDFAVWYGEALSAARVTAARLAGEPEAQVLPTGDAAFAATAAAVEEAWSVLVNRDLLAAAERSGLRSFRLLLDLPVYALAGWIIYRVAVGFLAGEYVGVDFLLNAFLLAGAYLLAVRYCVRRVLSLRAGKLLREVTVRCRAEIALRFDRVREAVEASTRVKLGALRRVCELRESWRERLETRGPPGCLTPSCAPGVARRP
jgi:hypothetical protein